MSPKSKLQKSANKTKNLSLTPASNEQPALSSEDAQRLETEICWCIQQLQTALKSGKLTPKQVQDHTKAMNALMKNTTPLVKKRQVMRLSFGDYRAKMAAEEKRMAPANMKIRMSPATPNKNSVFIKKSSGNNFRFNFKESVMSESEDKSSDKPENHATTKTSNFHFAPSDNSFKFNFTVD